MRNYIIKNKCHKSDIVVLQFTTYTEEIYLSGRDKIYESIIAEI